MKIVVDAMGGDNAPFEIVKGAVAAAEKLGVEIVLVGRGEEILCCLDKMGVDSLPDGVEIANATQIITMDDEPATAVRVKSDSSMTVALKLLHDGKADAMISAGSTGALISGATLIAKRIRGIRRAAMAPAVPTPAGKMLIVDCGATAECTPEYLLQFAYMGYYYSKRIHGVENPRVGLLNIGAEDSKGTQLQKDTFALLKEASAAGRINFIGNIESREAILGGCDVCVCDGFSGNVFLKSIEGTAMFLVRELKSLFGKNIKTKLAGAAVRSDMAQIKKLLDASEVGGTMLLGITRPVIKAHGSSDARAVFNAVARAKEAAESGICTDISENIEYMKVSGGE